MKNLLTLFFVFLSFNIYSQNDETEKTRSSAISSLKITELEQLILNLNLEIDLGQLAMSEDPVKFEEDSVKSKYSSVIKPKVLEYSKKDTLVLFSKAFMNLPSREGLGEYDSITSKYSFFYKDICTNCLKYRYPTRTLEFYNSIIENEISNRYGKNWKENLKKEINEHNKNVENWVNFTILEDGKSVDTIYMKKIDNLQMNVLNENEIKKKYKEVIAKVHFMREGYVVRTHSEIYIQHTELILKAELKAWPSQNIDKIVVNFTSEANSLGIYTYVVK